MKKNILVGQSGGPTAVINASLYGVIAEGMARPEEVDHVYGMVNGIEGFLSGHVTDLSLLTREDLSLLKQTPAAYLGSCRFKLPENLDAPVYSLLFEKFTAMNIGACFYIGGNDSMDTVDKLSRYARIRRETISFIGVPKTIDNDLPVTDHTPGYGSAAKYVASTVREISLDASVYQQPAVTIVELMGRHAGWVTAASALARKYEGDNPVLIYLPETHFDFEQFTEDVTAALSKNSTVVICISEGISDARGKFICEYADAARLDTFGHKMLTGSGKMLENFIRDKFGVKVRSIELNVNQRCSGMMASATDIEESVLAGREGVKAAVSGLTGRMISFMRSENGPYHLECGTVDVNEVCNREKLFPSEWMNSRGTDVTQAFIDYVLPLIQGEVQRKTESGRPVYLYRKSPVQK